MSQAPKPDPIAHAQTKQDALVRENPGGVDEIVTKVGQAAPPSTPDSGDSTGGADVGPGGVAISLKDTKDAVGQADPTLNPDPNAKPGFSGADAAVAKKKAEIDALVTDKVLDAQLEYKDSLLCKQCHCECQKDAVLRFAKAVFERLMKDDKLPPNEFLEILNQSNVCVKSSHILKYEIKEEKPIPAKPVLEPEYKPDPPMKKEECVCQVDTKLVEDATQLIKDSYVPDVIVEADEDTGIVTVYDDQGNVKDIYGKDLLEEVLDIAKDVRENDDLDPVDVIKQVQ